VGFILQNSTLTTWCRENGVDPARAWRTLSGKQAGPKAIELRARIIAASKADDDAQATPRSTSTSYSGLEPAR
jgi:hypothetical protein